MNWKLAAPVFACIVVAITSIGCTAEVVVPRAPPTERVETYGAAPSAEHFWVKGHWHWNGNDFEWIQGHWEVRRPSAQWVHGHWRASGSGWVWVEGHWTTR